MGARNSSSIKTVGQCLLTKGSDDRISADSAQLKGEFKLDSVSAKSTHEFGNIAVIIIT